ncbi:MAG: MarR family winged helix-turn-helix transcriptional regulator [Solirubrobacteraceae bacterium]
MASTSTASAEQSHPADQRELAITELGVAFRRVFRALNRMRGRDTHLSGSDVTHAQFELLIELYEGGELAAGELAQAAQLTPGTVTQMLDHLAESGHVERVRSETDRRVVRSRLTSIGRRKVQAKRVLWRGRWEQELAGVSTQDLHVAADVLARLSAVFAEDADSDACSQLRASTPRQEPSSARGKSR